MKLLFVALTKHQYRYFNILANNLYTDAKQLFLPSIRFSLQGFIKSFSLDTSVIENTKYQEVDAKYTNPFKRLLYKRFLKVQIPLVYAAVCSAIIRYDPDFVVFWNGKKFHQSIGVEVARALGKKTLFFENGLLPHTTQMDFQGVNASNSVPREVTFYQNMVFDDNCQLPDTLQPRVTQKVKKKQLEVLPKSYVFIPFQVAYDTQIIQHSPWIKDMPTLFALVLYLAQYHSDLDFVIKEHPSDRVSDYRDLYSQCVDNVHFSTLPTQELIKNAQVIMTVNSTVGIEGLLFGKRVIVLGDAFFAIEGLVKTASNRDELFEIMLKLQEWKIDTVLVENFLKYLYCKYLIPDSWREPTSKHFEAIQKRLRGEQRGA